MSTTVEVLADVFRECPLSPSPRSSWAIRAAGPSS